MLRMDERLIDNQTKADPKVRHHGFWSEIIKFTFITLLIVVPFRMFIAQPFVVSGASMDPTFHDGDYLIVDQLSKRFDNLERESVVIFKYPKDPSKFFIKRVIGLPGETIEIRNGVITIISNDLPEGLVLDEPYVDDKNRKSDNLTIVLNPDEYFVLGDNRIGSLDSRSWGPVNEKLIVGKPIVRLLPVNKAGLNPGDHSR